MESNRSDAKSPRPEVHPFVQYGTMLGSALCLLVVIVVSKPYFQEWSIAKSIAVVVGSGVFGAMIGSSAMSLMIALSGRVTEGDDSISTDPDKKSHHEGGILDAGHSHSGEGSGWGGHGGDAGGDT